MNWLSYLLPGELANLAITLTGLCTGIVSCTANMGNIFLITLAAWGLWMIGAIVFGFILYSLVRHIFDLPRTKGPAS